MKYKLKKDLPYAKAGAECESHGDTLHIKCYNSNYGGCNEYGHSLSIAEIINFDEWFEPVVENKLFEQIKEYLCSGLDIGPKDTANTLIEKFIKPAFDAGWYAYASDRTVFRGVALDTFLKYGINGVNNE